MGLRVVGVLTMPKPSWHGAFNYFAVEFHYDERLRCVVMKVRAQRGKAELVTSAMSLTDDLPLPYETEIDYYMRKATKQLGQFLLEQDTN